MAPQKQEKKKPGRKRTKLSKTAQLLANLPLGFTFVGPEGCCTEDYVLAELKNELLCQNSDEFSASRRLEMTAESDSRVFSIGLFTLDLERVKLSDLKSMRKLLPRTEYKLLKNRKCARRSRFRRKKQTLSLIEINQKLREENAMMRLQLGLPPAAEESHDNESSYYDNDSDGADIKTELGSLTQQSTMLLLPEKMKGCSQRSKSGEVIMEKDGDV